jgi:hypothetical protein
LNASAELANVEPEDIECSKCPPLSAGLTYRIKFRNFGTTRAANVVISSISGSPNIFSGSNANFHIDFLEGDVENYTPYSSVFPERKWMPSSFDAFDRAGAAAQLYIVVDISYSDILDGLHHNKIAYELDHSSYEVLGGGPCKFVRQAIPNS